MKKLSPTFSKLVSILNDGHFHDGTQLGEKLGMTRSAVWKAMQKLQDYGLKVESIKGKGYALLENLILLNMRTIKQGLNENNIQLHLFESIASTNDYLRAHKNNQIQICIAEQQTQGKGRMGRVWHSPFGQNIYLSCAYPFQKDVSELAGLSLAVCLAVVKTLESYALPHALTVKWPNDVLYRLKKICGTLIEIQAESHGTSHAVIGIGINVNMTNDDDEITQAWTSLRQITGEYIDRNKLCIQLINHLLGYLDLFQQNGLAHFMDEWNAADGLLNKEITLQNHQQKMTGKALGINAQGHLRLQTADNQIMILSSGETTLKKS